MNTLWILIAIMIFSIIYLSRSTFTSTLPPMNYQPTPPDCNVPRGHLPGSDILLTDSEKMNLLQQFANNGPELI
jgi:hypothetical protein